MPLGNLNTIDELKILTEKNEYILREIEYHDKSIKKYELFHPMYSWILYFYDDDIPFILNVFKSIYI